MVPLQVLSVKHDICHYNKYNQADTFLYNFQLYKTKWASVVLKAYAIGRHLTTIFKKGDSP